MDLVSSTLYGFWPHPQHCRTLIVSSTLYILYILDTEWILNPVLAWYPKHCMNMMITSPTLYELDCILNIVQNLHPQDCLDPQHCMDPISQTLYEQDCILNTVWAQYEPDCVLNTVWNLHPTPYTFDTVQTMAVSSILHGLWIPNILLSTSTRL